MEFTPRAEKAFRLAQAEADSLRHSAVGSQHLVLGLILLGDGVQFAVLQELGCTADSLRRNIVAIGPPKEEMERTGDHEFGVSAARALHRANQEARAMRHTYVGTEHILLGLFSEQSGPAAKLFSAERVDTTRGRQIILDEYKQV